MKKKIVVVALVMALAAMLAAGLTMAYFTDTAKAENVMVMGNVDIAQLEQQFKRNADGSIQASNREDFEQDRMVLPVTKDPDTLTVNENGGYPYLDLANAIDKIVTVKNQGNTGAYVRTVFAFEVVDGYALNADNGWTFVGNNTAWDWSFDPAIQVEVNGVKYHLVIATYKTELAKDTVTEPNLTQYIMMPGATQELVAGLWDPADPTDKLEILVVTQAVQADGFEDAVTALNAAFGEITAENNPFVSAANP